MGDSEASIGKNSPQGKIINHPPSISSVITGLVTEPRLTAAPHSSSDRDHFKNLYNPIDKLLELLPTTMPDDPRRDLFNKLYIQIQKESSLQLASGALSDKQHFPSLVARLAILSSIAEKQHDVILSNFIRNIFEKNILPLESTLDISNNPILITQGLQILTSILKPTYSGDKRQTTDLVFTSLQRQFPAVTAALENRLEGFNYIPLLKKLLDYGLPDFVSQVLEVLQKQVSQGNGLTILNNFFKDEKDERYYEKMKPIIRTQLEFYGLDPGVLIPAWEYCFQSKTERDPKVMILRQNLSTIEALEKFDAGAAKSLINRGIKHLGRYPPEILIKQYLEDKADKIETRPYNFFIGVTSVDPNGFFYQQREFLSKMAEQLEEKFPGKYRIRIFEFDSALMGIHNLNHLRKKFGKAIMGIIANHGNPFSILTGEDENVTLDDLKRPGAHAISMSFEPDASLILLSCSTGKKTVDASDVMNPENDKYIRQKGFAAAASEAIGLRISAPKIDTTGLSSYSVEVQESADGLPEVSVSFIEGESASTTYVRGEQVS